MELDGDVAAPRYGVACHLGREPEALEETKHGATSVGGIRTPGTGTEGEPTSDSESGVRRLLWPVGLFLENSGEDLGQQSVGRGVPRTRSTLSGRKS